MQSAVADFVTYSFHFLPRRVVVDYLKSNRIEYFIFLGEVLPHHGRQAPGDCNQLCFKLLKPQFVKQYCHTSKVVDLGSDIDMVALYRSAETNPSVLSQKGENNIVFPLDVSFHRDQMLNNMCELTKFRTDVGKVILIRYGFCDIIEMCQQAAEHVMLDQHHSHKVISRKPAPAIGALLFYSHQHKRGREQLHELDGVAVADKALLGEGDIVWAQIVQKPVGFLTKQPGVFAPVDSSQKPGQGFRFSAVGRVCHLVIPETASNLTCRDFESLLLHNARRRNRTSQYSRFIQPPPKPEWLTCGLHCRIFQSNREAKEILGPGVIYRYHGPRAVLVLMLGLLLAVVTTSNPAGERRELLTTYIIITATSCLGPCWARQPWLL